jgi:hypothetical protein
MLTLLRRAEDLLIQVLRLVLLAFSIFVLFGMGHWIWDHYKPKPDIATAGATALNWKDAPYDLKYMEEETGRDLSGLGNAVPMEKRLADPALRPRFPQGRRPAAWLHLPGHGCAQTRRNGKQQPGPGSHPPPAQGRCPALGRRCQPPDQNARGT